MPLIMARSRISPARRGRVGWSDRRRWRGPSSTSVRGIEMVAPFEVLCLLSLRLRGVGEHEAFLPGAAAARGQSRGEVGVRHRGRVRGHRAAGPGRRPFPPPRQPTEDRKVLLEALLELAPHAAAEGVWLAVEPINRYEDFMVNRIDQAVSLGEEVERETGVGSVRGCADLFHMNIE